jgi:hypothetical protein
MDAWMNPWQADCARVGLAEPSTDLGEIKRAYAKTLRKTRPDDDAQAYQALREAYDRVVAHARWHQEHGRTETPAEAGIEAAEVVETAVEANADAGLAAAQTSDPAEASAHIPPMPLHRLNENEDAATRPEPRSARPVEAEPVAAEPVETGPTPESLCKDLVELLKRGPAKVESALPALRLALGGLPLSSQLEASARFADLVIALQDQVPGLLIDLLRDHFDWSRDFRTERLLGAERMAALAQVLDRRPVPVSDPETLAEFAPTVRVAQLAGSMHGFDQIKAALGVWLMGHALPLHLQWAGWQLLRRLGLDEAELGAVNRLIARVRNLAVVHIALLVSAVDLALRHDLSTAIERGFSALMSLVIFCTAMGYGARLLDFLREAVPAKVTRMLAGGRWERLSPWVGAGCFALAGAAFQAAPLLAGDGGVALVTAGVGAFIAGVLLGLKGPLHLVVTATALWGFLVQALPSTTLLGAGLVAAWVSAGTSVYRLRLYGPNPDFRIQPRWPHGGAKAMLALLTVGLPTLMSWLSVLGGMRLTLGALTVAYAGLSRFLAHTDPEPRALILLGAFYLTLGLGLAVQRAGWWLGRRCFRGRALAR